MPKYPKNFKDVDFYPHIIKPGKKCRRLIGTTKTPFLTLDLEEDSML